jgi:ORF6N domain
MNVMLDSDLAELYGVETGALVRAVKRNNNRFPEDFSALNENLDKCAF